MKYALTLLFVLFNLVSFTQETGTLKKKSNKTPGVIVFITKVDIAHATKDGIYLNGYVVNIGYEQAKKLNGKKIKVTGKVTVVKGLGNLPDKDAVQGREGDTKHIETPKIEIIRN